MKITIEYVYEESIMGEPFIALRSFSSYNEGEKHYINTVRGDVGVVGRLIYREIKEQILHQSNYGNDQPIE